MKMTRRILSWALAIAMVITCGITGLVLPVGAEGEESVNLIVNGDFEAEEPGNWTVAKESGDLTMEKAIVADAGVNGTAGVKIATTVSEGGSNLMYGVQYQNILSMLEGDTTYRLSFMYKHTGKGRGQIYFVTGNYGTLLNAVADIKAGTELKGAAFYLTAGEVDWKEYTFIFKTPESIDLASNLMFRQVQWSSESGDGAAYFDNVELVELPEATSIALDKTASVVVGNTITLQATAQPEDAFVPSYTWTSNDDRIATVDADGVVTGVHAGEVTITASAEGGLSASCTVTVEKENLLPGGDFEGTLSTDVWDAPGSKTYSIENENGNAYAKIYDSTGEGFSLFTAKNKTLWNKVENGKVYKLTFDYKHSGAEFRVEFRGSGDLDIATHHAIAGGVPATISNNSTTYYWYDWKADTDEWKKAEILLTLVNKGSIAGSTKNFFGFRIRQFDTGKTTPGTTCVDNVNFVEMDASAGVSDTSSFKSVTYNGKIELSTPSSDTPATAIENVLPGTVVTAKVTPDGGYMMVPGSLKYTTSTGDVKILNKAEGDFGVGVGNEFAFEMPENPVHVTAEFVKMADENQNFLMQSIAASVHEATDEDGNVIPDAYDGIRYLTRLSLQNGFSGKGDRLEVKVAGKTYKVKEIGSLLKRKESTVTLDYATAEKNVKTSGTDRMWISKAYTEGGSYVLTDYTESYIDFAVVMMTKYKEREYTARGYMLLENVGNAADTLEVYSDATFTDSINTVKDRL